MRITAEKFNERKENRIRGRYEVKPPNTERRGRKKLGPHCEQCGRETEYLFPAPVTKPCHAHPGGHTRDGLVCHACRPPSNLEIQEMLEQGKYKGQVIETRTL
jgi:hypothetical protein